MLENQVKSIYLGIGSNLGNKKVNIEKAKFELAQNDIKILKSSKYYESISWPNPNNPKFLNIVLKINTFLEPSELLKKCKNIEIKMGRKKSKKNSPIMEFFIVKKKVLLSCGVMVHQKENFFMFRT